MMPTLLIILVVLWITGIIKIPGIVLRDIVIFRLNGKPISVWDLVLFIVIIWAIKELPSPVREIAGIFLILWILSLLGFIVIAGLSNLLIIALIIGIVISIARK